MPPNTPKISAIMVSKGKAISMARMGFAEVTCPTTRPLEDLFYPNSKTIGEKVSEMLKIDIDFSRVEIDNKELQEFKGPF